MGQRNTCRKEWEDNEMLKGDLRKKQILETSEKLFCEKGYEKTSVQDILNELHLSKGSFYHHFDSKERLLHAMCESHAMAAASLFPRTDGALDGMGRINRVLSAMIPFNGEGLRFLMMIMPVFPMPEGRSIREGYQDALKKAWLPVMTQTLDGVRETREIYCEEPEGIAGICLDLLNDLWCKVSEEIILAETDPNRQNADLGEMMSTIVRYRSVLENILSAPYGSLVLLDVDHLNELSQQVHLHWRVQAEKE